MSHHSFHFNCHLFHFLLCVKYVTWWPLLILTKSCKVAASHFTDEETFQMRKLDSERPRGLSRVNKWQNQDSNLSLYDPKAHSLFTLLPCLQIKHKFNPWRVACFLWNQQNDKNYAVKGGVLAPGPLDEMNEKVKMYQRLQKGLSKVQSISERGGHEVCHHWHRCPGR